MRKLMAGLLTAAFLSWSGPVLSEDAGPIAESGILGWEMIVSKALAFEFVSSLVESAVFVGFYGGSASTAGTIFIVSLASASAVYVVHEYAWEYAIEGWIDRDDPWLIAVKAGSYRIASTLRSFTVGSLLGGAEMTTSAAFALTVAAADTLLYVANEVFFLIIGDVTTVAEPRGR